MAETNPVDRAWELMKGISICSLVTDRKDRVHSRPMAATVDKEEHAIYFLTDVDGVKDDEIEENPKVSLIFSDIGHQKYVHVDGTATVSEDREKIREIWTPFAKAWWDSPEDPSIRLLRVAPRSAEYWDSPGTIVAYATMLKAAVFGGEPEPGENKKVPL